MRADRRTLPVMLTVLAALCGPSGEVRAETVEPIASAPARSGPASRIVLAQELYQAAIEQGDPVLLVAAIRLARAVTLRPASIWTKSTTGPAAPDQPAGRPGAPDPASAEVLAIAESLAGEDPVLQDLVYGVVAQLPEVRQATTLEARSELFGGQTDTWRVALSGGVPAEFGLVGDGDTALGLEVTDEDGRPVCTVSARTTPTLCRFTPSRNGFFDIHVESIGSQRNSYRLVGGG